MIYIEILLSVISLILLTPTLVIFTQVLSAFLLREIKNDISGGEVNFTVLIPAHNESTGIIATINSIKPQLESTDRLLVVADNCTDDTAVIARANGAEVIERNDLEHRGKGFALDFGIQHISKKPTEVVVIIDADCIVESNGLRRIAAFAMQNGRPVQALYLMYAKSTSLKSRVSEFAWCVKNLVRPLGYAKLGLPCQLMGTGMAFPWNTIVNADLANGNIVEDMKLGIDLSISGTPPLFYSQSMVTSFFPVISEVQSGQRTRWEHGHLSMILSEAPRLFAQAIIQGDKNLLAIAFDLSVPPLALLMSLMFGYATLTGMSLMLYDVGYIAFLVSLSGVTLFILAIGIAWMGWGRSILSFSTMLLIPVYVVSKIPHYVKFMFKRQKTWNKTERD